MLTSKPETAKLILDDGTQFCGILIGTKKSCIGEIVFNTSMTGYLETLTDPSFFGQVVVQTFPLVGNYGVCEADMQSRKAWPKGFITRQICDKPSNFRSTQTLSEWLEKNEVCAISQIDTRSLTKKIRTGLIKNCAIIADSEANKPEILEKIKKFKIENAVKNTSTKMPITLTKKDFNPPCHNLIYNKKIENNPFKICVLDFGTKINILQNLVLRCNEVLVLPYDTSPEKIENLKPDGLVLSNGPGDPAENKKIIENIKKIQNLKIPTFGICLGHQLLALANGAKTTKLKFGHRGSNHPVLHTKTNKTFITSQNHGFVVDSKSIDPKTARISFINLNDNSCEGLEFLNFPAFSVQFHPEACAGPLDLNFLFDEFFSLIKKTKKLTKVN